jgi:Zn-dependent peptidase ImmA (M78 family)/transcriptional regulator with XRE-family HTH domain
MALDREALARALREARENHGISQETAAKRLRLSRTVLAQIELGNRRVSDDELSRFAALYETSLADLTGTELPSSDDLELILFDVAPELVLDETTKEGISSVLGLLRIASSLEEVLGFRWRGAPRYSGTSPSNAVDAISQGEHVATQERNRLGLVGSPAGDLASLAAAQGIHVSTTHLPDGFAGLFLRHPDVGVAIVVNSEDGPVRRRFAVLQAYAHGLFERGNVLRTTKRSNAGELIAKRANAFAAAFLLPEKGIRELLESWGKGHGSRREYIVLDVTTDETIRAEQRATPGSQAITYADVVAIAGRFGASYKAVVFRLLSLGMISETECRALLSTKAQRAAEQCAALTSPHAESGAYRDDRSGLKADVLHLAIECYRRRLITKDKLAEIGGTLQLAALPKAKLLELAEAAR